MMELGITTFGETTPDVNTGVVVEHDERIRQVLAEIVLADQVGLDVYGIGEHHRKDFAISSPEMVLAAAAPLTKKIRLFSATTILSTDDPVRVYQRFATLDALSKGRAEVMVGRGSFTESYPLFGEDLADYDELFEEKLDLLLKIQKNEELTWSGKFRQPLINAPIYPRSVQDPLPIVVGTGGNPESVARAGILGLPLSIAIIGGEIEYFKPLIDLYKKAAEGSGHDPSTLQISSHSHGYIAPTMEEAFEDFYPPTAFMMNTLAKERRWPEYTAESFRQASTLGGALFAGDVKHVSEKIINLHEKLGIQRFMLHLPLGSMPHDKVMRAIELFGREVAPIVRKATEK